MDRMFAKTLQNGFPGPRLAGVALVLGPLVMLAAAALLMEFEGGEFEEIQQRIADQPLRAEVGLNLMIVGWLLMTLGVLTLARLIAQRHPTLAAFAGVLTLMGLVVSFVFAGIATIEHGVAEFPDRGLAAQLEPVIAPPVALLLFLPGIPLGWLLLAVGSWRAGVLGPVRAAMLLGPIGVPVGAILGFPVALVIGFAAVSIALVPLGVQILRAPATAGAKRAGVPAE